MGYYGSSNIDNLYSHLEEHKETLTGVIDDLTNYYFIAELKITSFWYRAKSKASIGVKNTASYIPWLYTTWDQMVASNMIHCVLVLMETASFLYHVQTMLVYYLMFNHI